MKNIKKKEKNGGGGEGSNRMKNVYIIMESPIATSVTFKMGEPPRLDSV